KDVTYLKGPGVQNVAADVAAAQAKAATAKAAMKSALTSAQATLSTSATQRTRGSGPAPASAALGSGGGNGLGGGASSAGDGRQGAGSANQSAARGDSRTKATAQRLYDAFVSKWVGGQRASTGANALATVNTSTGPGIGVLDNLGTVTIQNFTITGFNNTGVDDAGGAIFVGINTPVVIQNNAIRLNSASRGGGVALLSQNDNSQITNNVFENNIAESSVGIGSDGSMALEGGAIWVFSNSQNLVISGNRLTSNAARGPGGAVAVGRANANALISGNTCQSSVGGPGVRGDGEGGCVKVTGGGFGGDGLNDNLMVTNNSFLQNSAATDAGALHIGMGNHNPTVTGNTFRENTTTGNAV